MDETPPTALGATPVATPAAAILDGPASTATSSSVGTEAAAAPATTGTEPTATTVEARYEPERAPEPPLRLPSLRAPLVFLIVLIGISSVFYPLVLTGVADAFFPTSPATVANEIGENVSNPALFWLRPSLLDWNTSDGSGTSPYGPVDPALRAQIQSYIDEYGLYNSTVPLDLVTPSYSGFDPDLYPDAALVQVPRVVHFSNLSLPTVWHLVNESTVQPAGGIVGPTYVNIIELDRAMLLLLPPGTPVQEPDS